MKSNAELSHASVTLENCHQLRNATSPFILALDEAENVFSALRLCALRTNLKSAIVLGLGSLQDIQLGYYKHTINQHEIKLFKGIYEISSLTGSITYLEKEPFIHIHAGISHNDFTVYGGHVLEAYSGPATELIISPFNATIHREFNQKLGIYTICREQFNHA